MPWLPWVVWRQIIMPIRLNNECMIDFIFWRQMDMSLLKLPNHSGQARLRLHFSQQIFANEYTALVIIYLFRALLTTQCITMISALKIACCKN